MTEQQQPTWPPPAPPRKRRGCLLGLAIVAGAAILGVVVANTNGRGITTPPQVYTGPAANPPTTAAATSPAGLRTDGVYEVGPEIKPGTWKTDGRGTPGLGGCYWSRNRDADGLDIIANNLSPGRQTMTVRAADGYVELSGGCTWQRVRS
jgi:hypothetical protein